MADLRECPFCGGRKKVVLQGAEGHLFFVKCFDCYAVGPSSEIRDEAVNAWNHRRADEIEAEIAAYARRKEEERLERNREYARKYYHEHAIPRLLTCQQPGCGKVFMGLNARYCPCCIKKRLSQNAKNRNLNGLGRLAQDAKEG